MKLTIALLCAFACICSVSATIDLKTTWDKYKQYYEFCKRDYSLDYDIFKGIINEDREPETNNEKCFVKCFLKQKKAITDTGEADLTAMIEGFQTKFEGANLFKASKIAKTCVTTVPKVNLTGCDYATNIYKCFWLEGKKEGLVRPKFEEA